jgi:putative hydrolase of the HAD superfamily
VSEPFALLFDFGGTLDADGIPWAPRFYAAYRAAGGTVDAPAFEAAFRASDRALERASGVSELGFRDMVRAQIDQLHLLLPDGGLVDAARVGERFHDDVVAVVSRNRPLLERLSARWRLGVVSNFTGNLEPCLVELGIRRWFTVVMDSAVVGIAKPDTRIFADALARLDVPPARAWMVGDNFEADLRPAAALGMRTCWLAAAERLVPDGAGPTARIERLLEIERVVQARGAAAAPA